VILHIALILGCVSTTSKNVSPSAIAEANANLASEYFRMGRMEEALRAAKKAVVADSESVVANSLLAVIYQKLEMPLKANEYFFSAIELHQEDDAGYGVIRNNYGVFLCQQGEYIDAEENFLLAAKNKLYRTPQNAYENAGICALKFNKIGKAENYFKKALAFSPTMARSLVELAAIQYDAQNFLSARAYLQRYHAVAEGSAESLFLTIKAELKLGADEEAQRIINVLIERFPDSKEAKVLAN